MEFKNSSSFPDDRNIDLKYLTLVGNPRQSNPIKINDVIRDQDFTPNRVQVIPPRASGTYNEIVPTMEKDDDSKNRYRRVIQMLKSSASIHGNEEGARKKSSQEVTQQMENPKLKNLNEAIEKRDEQQTLKNYNLITQLKGQFEKHLRSNLENLSKNECEERRQNEDIPSKIINLLPSTTLQNKREMKIYWTQDKLDSIKLKFKTAKGIIIELQDKFVKDIEKAIADGDMVRIRYNHINFPRELMLNETNQRFYKRQLEGSSFLSDILLSNRIDNLLEVLNDKFYKWDETFIFEHLGSQLKIKHKLDQTSLCTLLKNVVEYNLYRKSLIKVLGWFICSFGFYDIFRMLVEKNLRDYEKERSDYENFSNDDNVFEYLENDQTYYQTLIVCLREDLQALAIEVINFQGKLDNKEVINIAVKCNSKLFLKTIWEQTTKPHFEDEITNKFFNKRKSSKNLSRNEGKRKTRNTIFESSIFTTLLHSNNTKVFTVTELILKFQEEKNKDTIHEIISKWSSLNMDPDLLATLFQLKAYDDIAILIYKYPNTWIFSSDQFRAVIEDNGLNLILEFLKSRDCRSVIHSKDIQKIIVKKYLHEGELMYYGAEMLSYISKSSWDINLTNDLLRTIDKSIKTRKILNCHSPVLTCLLLSEFLTSIGDISIHYQARCDKTKKELMNFCKSIHEANPDEKYIKFLMTQKDSKNRSAYQIAADCEAYVVLESPEVGTIVRKMWDGRLSHEGLYAFSSLAKYIENPSGRGYSPFSNFDPVDSSKTYFHQLDLWTESCSLRYYPESLSTILLIVNYNLVIYLLVSEDLVMTPLTALRSELQIMIIGYIAWVFGIVLNIPMQIVFSILSGKRRYRMDKWGYIEMCMLISALLLLLDTNIVFPNYDASGNLIPSNEKSDSAFILRAIILSVNDIFVWLRITGILLTYKELGPLIRMIYCLSQVTAQYLVIYALYITCCAAIFTAIFYRASSQFASFSVTFTTLFAGFINNLDCFTFDYWNDFGAFAVLLYVTLSGLMLINLIIAMLSNEYLTLSKGVDSAHRSVLIRYFRRYKWDKQYGYLILLTTPLNIINFLVIPFNICFKDKISFNTFISRVYFMIFYLPIIVLLQVSVSLIFIPLCYIIGTFYSIIDQYTRRDINILKKFLLVIFWLIGGLFYLFGIYFRDIWNLCGLIFKKIDVEACDLEKKRIKQFIKSDDIRNFLQFMHKRSKGEQNDLHSLFIDFLDFEHEKKAEMDKDFRLQTSYLQKLRSAGKVKKRFSYSMSLYSLKKPTLKEKDANNILQSEEQDNDSGNLSGRIIKRNLIIIEILENFLIDDGSENFIVDIDKLKMLLPKTMNINSAYIKRLVHTDISSLSRAVNKLKNKSNAFLQHKLLNKIVGSIIRLDKIVDDEGNRDPLQDEEERKKNNFDIEENEDDFYSTLEDLLRRIANDVNENIKVVEQKIQEQEKEVGQSGIHQRIRLVRGSTKINKLSFTKLIK